MHSTVVTMSYSVWVISVGGWVDWVMVTCATTSSIEVDYASRFNLQSDEGSAVTCILGIFLQFCILCSFSVCRHIKGCLKIDGELSKA